jgi:drug/metabolite transporter (DMT)-like permease
MPGLFVAGVRQFLSGLILVLFFLARGARLPSWPELRRISVQGILLLCIANGLLTWAMEYISGGLAAIIVALVPIFVAIFSILFSHMGRVTARMVAGLVIGFAGVLIIFSDYFGEMQAPGFVLGIVLSLVSVLSWSLGTVYSAKQKSTISILFNVGLQMLIAGIIMLAVCGITGKYVNLANESQDAWMALLYLIVFGSLVAYSAYVFAISKLPPTLVSIYAYINPVVAVGLGWLLLAEKMNLVMLMGMVVTLGGVYIVNREFKRARS